MQMWQKCFWRKGIMVQGRSHRKMRPQWIGYNTCYIKYILLWIYWWCPLKMIYCLIMRTGNTTVSHFTKTYFTVCSLIYCILCITDFLIVHDKQCHFIQCYKPQITFFLFFLLNGFGSHINILIYFYIFYMQ